MTAKRIAVLGALTALSLIMFLVESLFPPLFVPGAKLGLGNIFILLAVIYLSVYEAVLLVIAKSVIACFFGGFSSLMYSLPAGVISLIITATLIRLFSHKISVVSVAVVSSVAHNLVQNLVFSITTQSIRVLSYMPYLAVIGCFAGLVTGLSAYYIVKYLSKVIINKLYNS